MNLGCVVPPLLLTILTKWGRFEKHLGRTATWLGNEMDVGSVMGEAEIKEIFQVFHLENGQLAVSFTKLEK